MAASTGGENMEVTPSVENASKLANNLQQSAEKVEEVSTNGTASSFATARKGPSILRPSLFSPNTASGSSIPVFGSHNSTSPFRSGNFSRKLPINAGNLIKDPPPKDEGEDAVQRLLRTSDLDSPASDVPSECTTNYTNSSFVLSPAKLNNPFFKAAHNNDNSNGSTVTSTCSETNNTSPQEPEKPNWISKLAFKIPVRSKVSFVPLASSASSSSQPQPQAPTTASTTVPTFVFGQNLHERVEVPSEAVRSEAENSGTAAASSSSCDGEVSKTNGVTPEMLFTSVIQRDLPDKQSEMANDERKRKSLSEAAREYEESRAVKRKYEEVAVKTGEEEEINILQINCKLFAFNKDKSNWVERGRGTLRLNDLSVDNRTQSRVVMRVSGSLRVVLNTKIWAEMTVDRPSEKSVRLTALDSSGEIKVFLVMAGVKEIDQLFKALDWRVNNQKKLASASEKSTETDVS